MKLKNKIGRDCHAHLLILLVFAIGLGFGGVHHAQAADTGSITVRVDQPGHRISPMLYGLMTEEINHSYDGGLYGELIQNRIFKDDANRPVHWSRIDGPDAKCGIALDTKNPVNNAALTTSLRLDVTDVKNNARAGVANSGYWGIPVTPNTRYHASFYAEANAGFTGPVTIDIESNDGATIFASATIPTITDKWNHYSVDLTTQNVKPSGNNRLVISVNNPCILRLNLVSLFPPTFNNRPNGNRIDLMQKLADMHPSFLRLPGGNYLEGDTIDQRFDWEKTIHSLENRPGHQGPWRYRSSDGLGLLEFLEWTEDLHMQPILAVFAGYALQGQHISPGPDLQKFVQEALDEIEYSTGDTTTKWGQERAKDGHSAPFKIEYVEIGNEDWFDVSRSYDGRFAQFFDAIKAKYPALKLIATTPVRSRVPDVLDDHYYRTARAMERDVHHYDNASRTGPKIFVGEWASTEGRPTPTMNAALGDAAWLTGLERNSDLVILSCYAPLLVNVNRGASQWGTNLIGYDALSSFGSPSYYAQKMFSENRGDTVLPVEIVSPAVKTEPVPPHGRVGVGTWATQAEFKDVKVMHGDKVLYQTNFADTTAWKPHGGNWNVEAGVLKQSGRSDDCEMSIGDAAWTDYTYTLKARKISGNEGFLILFHAQDNDNYTWWNVGGWGNSRTALETVSGGDKTEFGPSAPVTVDAGRWYDVKIEVSGTEIQCFLDGALVEQADMPSAKPLDPIFATASRVDASGDLILKVVNVSEAPQTLTINLQGVSQIDANGSAEVLAGRPGDVNSIQMPENVVPRHITVGNAAATFVHEFPACSVNVIRLKTK